MSLPPKEIPLGAMRFNSDSQKLEYFNGDVWMQVHTFSPNLDGGGRAVLAGNSGGADTIDYVTIATPGNAIDFGNLTSSWGYCRGTGSSIRGIFGQNTTNVADTVEYITFSTTGDAVDFGNLVQQKVGGPAGFSNSTRGCFAGGAAPSAIDEIDYVTMASTGNAKDFGNLSAARSVPAQTASSTRGIIAGGTQGSPLVEVNIIEYVQIASTGDVVDFGDLTLTREQPAGCSNGHGGL